MTTKLAWQTGIPTKTTHALVVAKTDDEPPFLAIAEYDPENETWFERGGLNLQLIGDKIIRWAEFEQLNKLLKE